MRKIYSFSILIVAFHFRFLTVNAQSGWGTAPLVSKSNPVENKEILIYPSPSDGFIAIDLTEYLRGPITTIIYNTLGNKISENQFQPNAKYEIGFEYLSTGLYFIRIEDADKNIFFKKISLMVNYRN